MAIQVGPRFFSIIPADAASVKIRTLGGGPVNLAAPVTVDEAGRVSFALYEPGQYRISITNAQGGGIDTDFTVSASSSADGPDNDTLFDHIDERVEQKVYQLTTTAVSASSAAASALSAVQAQMPANGSRAIGKNELVINVKDYGAVGNGSTDDTAAVQAAIAAASSSGVPSTVRFPAGNYRLTDTITVDGVSVNIEGEGLVSSLVFFNDIATEYGLVFNNLGGGFQLNKLSIRGNAKAMIRVVDSALFHIDDVIIYNCQSPALHLIGCIDWRVDNVDIQSGAGRGEGPDSVVYLLDSSQGYFRYLRIEGPTGAGIFIEGNSGVKFTHGKVDGGNAGAGGTYPYVIVKDNTATGNEILFNQFSIVGFLSYPTEIRGAAQIAFDTVYFTQGPANALCKATAAYPVVKPSGALDGWTRIPMITFRNCRIEAEAENFTSGIKALAYVTCPAPEQLGADFSPLPMRSTATGTGGATGTDSFDGYIRRITSHDNGAGTFVYPSTNGVYVGYWLTHMQTGKRARVFSSVGTTGINAMDYPAAGTDDFPNGDFYRLETTGDTPVRVVSVNNDVVYRTRRLPNVFSLTYHAAEVSVSSVAYSTFKTTVTLSTAASSTWIGMHLHNPATGEYFQIRETSGFNMVLDYDVAAKIPAGRYHIRAGKPTGTFKWIE